MNYILFGLYNFICQIFTIALLFYSNTYLNGLIIPDSLKWENGNLIKNLKVLETAQIIILLIEVVALILLLFYINRKYLLRIVKTTNATSIAVRTTFIYSFNTIAFIIFLIHEAFK